MSSPLKLSVLISGGGTTMVNLQERIAQGHLSAQIVGVIASRDCFGVQRSRELDLSCQIISPTSFSNVQEFSVKLFETIRNSRADLVVLAGFLSRIHIPDDFSDRVMNIHPSLIPAFCGQGMYGHHVHEAVINRGCKISGCTVHFCDNEYDHGPIVLQKCVPVLAGDDSDSLAQRVNAAEREIYPEAIQLFGEGRLRIDGRSVLIEPNNSSSTT